MKIGVVAGAFDVVHPGYIKMFNECKKHCDELHVFIHIDPSVERPTKLKDFIFISRIIAKENPVLCISNFGSTNVVSIASYIFRVSIRINYLHTSPYQIKIDTKRLPIIDWFLQKRKKIILNHKRNIKITI